MIRDFRTVAIGIWAVVVDFHNGGEKLGQISNIVWARRNL